MLDIKFQFLKGGSMKEKSLFLAIFTFVVAQLVSSVVMFGLFNNPLINLKFLFLPLAFLCLNFIYFQLFQNSIEINRESGKLKNDSMGVLAFLLISILPIFTELKFFQSLIFIVLFIASVWAWLFGIYVLDCKENGINIFQNTESVPIQDDCEQNQSEDGGETCSERREMVFEFEKDYKKPE